MSTPVLASPRRTRRGVVIASLIAAAVALTGCGAADSYDSTEPAADRDYPGSAGEPAYAELDGSVNYSADEGGQAPDPSPDGRSLIITGSLYMTVEDPIVAADRAAGIVRNAGGRIDARRETAPDERYGGSAALTLRIPSSQLDTVVDDLRDLGTVDEFSTHSYDVTNEVIDLEAQISTLRASTERIQSLLLEAEDIGDIITLENELDSRLSQLEGLEARQRGLDDQVSMSSIELSLTTEPVVILEDPPDEPETFMDGLENGWNALVGFASALLIIAGTALPWIALVVVLVLAMVVAFRNRKSRRTRRNAAHPDKVSGASSAKKAD